MKEVPVGCIYVYDKYGFPLRLGFLTWLGIGQPRVTIKGFTATPTGYGSQKDKNGMQYK